MAKKSNSPVVSRLQSVAGKMHNTGIIKLTPFLARLLPRRRFEIDQIVKCKLSLFRDDHRLVRRN